MDFDGDGERDLVSGSYDGPIFFFKGKGKGLFDAPVQVNGPDGKPLVLDYATTVAASDWNKDGKPDLVVGTISGPVWYLENKGNLTVAQPVKLSSSAGEMSSPDGGPCLVDWDGDGVTDLFLGEDSGRLWYFKGKSGGDRPQFESPAEVLPELSEDDVEPARAVTGSTLDWDLKRPKMRPKPSVCDWNGDGKLDLLVGDYGMTEGKAKPLSADQQKEFEKLRLEQTRLKHKASELNKEMTKKVFAQLGWDANKKLTPEESIKFSEVYDKLYQANTEALDTDTKLSALFEKLQPMMPEIELHGFVWLYLHK